MAYGQSSNDIQAFMREFKEWFFDGSCHEALNILITGKTGVGKSRLVNALVGRKVAEEGRAKDPCTSTVTSYQLTFEGVTVNVWDSPGLQDGTTNEDKYIQDMKRKIKDVALMIYCMRMDDTRFFPGDKKAIRTLTNEFEKEVWNRAVVALTFANKVEDPDGGNELHYFQNQLKEWKRQFTGYFTEVGLDQRSKLIPIIPVGNKPKSMRLPDRDNWLSVLWIECYQVMKASARRGMYRINRHRLTSSNKYSPDEQKPVDGNGIPAKIPLNKEQQKGFVESTVDAFITACKGVSKVVSTVVGGIAGAVGGVFVGICGGIGRMLFG